jgi:hypothetical protein
VEELAVLEDGAVGVGAASASAMTESSCPACARTAAALVRLVNSADGLVSGFFRSVLGGAWCACWSTLKVNCMRLIVPGCALWLASRLRSFSTARCRIKSLEWLRLKSGASSSSILLHADKEQKKIEQKKNN